MLQLQVTNSPFTEEQTVLLNQLLPTLSPLQKIWLNGFLSASESISISEAAQPLQTASLPDKQLETAAAKEITVLYGSQTGNAQNLAEKKGKELKALGFSVTVASMSAFKTNQLKKVKNLLIIVSTHGEGDPPDTALAFHEFLHGKRAPKLDGLQYSVLSLGDSSYEFFCQTGKEFDERLQELGGTRIFDRVDCDLDFEESADEWFQGVTSALGENAGAVAENKPSAASTAPETIYSRTNPFYAEVLDVIQLNGRGSNKETYHIELSLEGSGIDYQPGDSLGIYPSNDPKLVASILETLSFSADEPVAINKQGNQVTIQEALTSHFEITVLTKPLLEKAASYSTNEQLSALLESDNTAALKEYTNGRDLLDLLTDFDPWKFDPQSFVSILRKLPARLYSISSSLAGYPEEAHLTIGAVRYHAHGRDRKGVCSVQFAERLQPGDTLPIYIQHNQNFKLPENPDTPIIMIGPGTGVAPFRSFLQEREENGTSGKSWLFFGDQHFVTDFLYQTEWQKWLSDGILTKMDVAFSRDKTEKVYVQHRMIEHSKLLFEWLQQGAVVYVCGDEKHMAHDVHQTLISIVEKEGNMTSESAAAYIAAMQQEKRYQRDVY